jgi:leucine efflux protein
MFDIQHYWSFVAAILVFQLVPGPGTIAILNATARNGMGAGMGAVCGTLVGDALFMVAAVLGLATVMKANPALFAALQWFGAAYLVWMGVQLLRAKMADASSAPAPQQSGWVFFRQAAAVSLTNPKVILFFVAFFPLFIKPDASAFTLGAMMLHVTMISLAYQALLVLVGHRVAQWFRRWPTARLIATRLAGMSLVGFGARLAVGNR